MSIQDIINKKLIKTNETYRAMLLESDTNNYIAIKCDKGHLYKLSVTDSQFEYRIKKCPFCIKSKSALHKNIKYLRNDINCLESFLLYMSYILAEDIYVVDYVKFMINNNIFYTKTEDSRFNRIDLHCSDINIKDSEVLNNIYSIDIFDYTEIIIPYIKNKFHVDYDSALRMLYDNDKIINDIAGSRIYLKTLKGVIQINNKLIGSTAVGQSLSEDYELGYRKLEIYTVKNNRSTNSKEVKELKSQIALLEKDIQDKLEKIHSLKQQVNELCNKNVYNNIGNFDNNLYMWLLNCEDKELAEIILNNYSTKNSKRLTEIPIDSKETIWIRGKSGSNFKTSAFIITSQKRVLDKLPKGTSYPELFIYFYFKSIFPETVHRGKAPNTRYEYDISIPEKRLVIEYNGSIFHNGEGKFDKTEIDTIKMNYAIDNGVDYIRIEDDGNNDIYFSDRLITFNGNVKNLDEKLYEICNIIKNKKLHSTRLKANTIEQIKRQIRLYY